MSTHDYVIDNQSAPAFRADLNNVLAAIASQNSSGTAPTVTFANMIWYDTGNNQIKKRNEANSAWIVLGTINETTGTFTPSGERALATQVQAEAGTDNATLMTPLRAAQAIAALAPTTDVGAGTAALSAGSVGSYSFAVRSTGTTDVLFGNTIAGTELEPASAIHSINTSSGTGNSSLISGPGVLSGTWRAMGRYDYSGLYIYGSTLFLRIA